MKSNRFLWLFFLFLAANAAVYFPSCQREAEQPELKPLSDTPVTERACTSGDYCEFTITATTTCTVEFCGDIDPSTGTCGGCGSLGNDKSLGNVTLTANVPYTICVLKTGSVCILNYPTGVQAINVTVQAGSSTPVSATIPVGESRCFHAIDNCGTTKAGCQ